MRPRMMVLSAILLSLTAGLVWTYGPHAVGSRRTPLPPVVAVAMPDSLFAWRDVTSIAEAQEMLFDSYRLPPDLRMITALGDLSRLADPKTKERADVRWAGDHWVVLLGDREVGKLPEFPDFEDGMALLDRWSAAQGTSAPQGDPLPEADAAFAQGDPLSALAALDASGETSRAHAAQAAHALTWIALATPDRPTRDGDALLARACAAAAWAGSAHSSDVRALLSYRMRYARRAEMLDRALPEGSAVRAFLDRDTETLERESARSAPGSLPDLLLLASTAEASQKDRWWSLMARPGRSDAARSLAFSTIVMLGRSFELSDTLMQGLLDQGLSEATRVGKMGSLKWEGLRRGTVASDLALRLSACEPSVKGPWLARGIALAHARTLTYAALQARFVHVTLSLGSRTATDELLAALGSSDDPVAGELVVWMQHVRDDHWGTPNSDRYRREILDSPHLASGVLGSQFRPRVAPSATDGTRTLRSLLRRMDSRPEHLSQLLFEADGMARVPAVRARWLAPLVSAGGDVGAFATLMRAIEHPDPEAWRAALASTRVPVRSKLAALAVRESSLPHDQHIESDFRVVLATHPSARQATLSLSSHLERSGRLVLARKVLESWRGGGHTDQAYFDTISVAIRMASLYRREGRPARSLQLLEPFMNVGKLSLVAEYARALDALGHESEAMEFAGALRSRYPQWVQSTALAAELHWRHGRDDAAAIAIASLGPRGAADWDESIAPVFLDVFRGRSDAAVAAARALASHLLKDSPMLIRLAMAFDSSGDPVTGFRICETSMQPGSNVLSSLTVGYDMLSRAEGEARAMAWFGSQRFGNPAQRAMAIEILAADDHGALALAEPLPTDPVHREFSLLVQAAAALALPEVNPQRAALAATLNAETGGDYLAIARYLLHGGDPGPTLSLARESKRRTEVFHWVGRRMEAESRWAEAAVLYQLSLETGARNNGEWGWSLKRLARVEQILRRLRPPGSVAAQPIAFAS